MRLQDQSTPAVVGVAPVTSARGPEVFHRAVEVLKTKHHVDDAAAYSMLVQASVEAGTSVREAARAIIRASLAHR
ncbi:MAG: ANTAR domain-containing protein [Marmoricola sp.]